VKSKVVMLEDTILLFNSNKSCPLQLRHHFKKRKSKNGRVEDSNVVLPI